MDSFVEKANLQDFSVLDNKKHPVSFKINCPYIIEGLLICLIEYGESRLTVNLKEYRTSRNTVLIITDKSIMEILELDKHRSVKGFYIPPDWLLEQNVFSDYEIFFKLTKNPFFSVDSATMKNLRAFYQFIEEMQVNHDEPFRDEINKYLFGAFSIKIKSIYHNLNVLDSVQQKTNNEIIVDNFYKLLFVHFIEERNISFYADKLCVTPKYLSSIVKKILGRPVYFWITQMLINHAKIKLKTSEMNVSEISDYLSFATPSLFCRFFKKNTGMTPLQYRLEG